MTAPRRVAIIQSSYIPWRGYFAMIAACDAFVFLDSVQFTRRDWRTRNAIKTSNGVIWLSVPVKQKGNFHASIDSIQIAEPTWARKHLRSFESAYSRAHAFKAIFPALTEGFLAIEHEASLSTMNQHLTRTICGILDIKTPLLRDVDLVPRTDLEAMDATDRLIQLALAAGGSEYVSGPSAKSYLDESRFHAVGLSVAWMDYASCLVPYQQLWGDFEPAVSIVDPLLNLGSAGVLATMPGGALGQACNQDG
jgi:hypothetical protein